MANGEVVCGNYGLDNELPYGLKKSYRETAKEREEEWEEIIRKLPEGEREFIKKLKRAERRKRVYQERVIVCDADGLPIQSDFDIETTEATAAYVTSLIGHARNTVDVLKEGELKCVRLETTKGGVLIALEQGVIAIVFYYPHSRFAVRIELNERAIVKRLNPWEGIRGVIVCDADGHPIQSYLDTKTTEATAAYVTSLIGSARNTVDVIKEGDLKCVRLKTTKGEVIISLEQNLIFIVLYYPHSRLAVRKELNEDIKDIRLRDGLRKL